MQIFNLEIDDETGLVRMSLVNSPAVEVDFLAFSKEEKKAMYFADEEKHIVTGVALRADFPVYRVAENGEEFYVNFTPSVIEKCVQKFMREQRGGEVDLEHNGKKVSGVYLFESYILRGGLKDERFADVKEGSWVVSYKVDNEEVWAKIKSGELKGFSVEGYFFENSDTADFDEWIRNFI